jgi:hypothetical protein
MRNGSLLMTSRLQAKTPNHYRPYPGNTTGPLDKQNKRRAFARSDNGGQTWSELWYLADRQPEIARYTSECAQGITSDPTTGELFWAHPGGGVDGHDRSNGTLQVRKRRPTLRHFILKMIILPRQARDKHRESTQKEDVFLQRSSNDGAEWEFAAHIGPETMGYGYGAIRDN